MNTRNGHRAVLLMVLTAVGCSDAVHTVRMSGANVQESEDGSLVVSYRRERDTDVLLDQNLSQLGSLIVREVSLVETDVSAVGIELVSKLKGLEKVFIVNGRGVRNAAVEQLSQVEGLRDLALLDTRITDGAIPHLAKLSRLERLAISNIRFESELQEHPFHQLENLRRLELLNVEISPLAAHQLAEMDQLASLTLVKCRMSDESERLLRTRMINCVINSSEG